MFKPIVVRPALTHQMLAGEIIRVDHGLYWHYAVCIGDGTVVELSKPAHGGTVRRVPFNAFTNGQAWSIVRYEAPLAKQQVIRRALGAVGQSGYDLISNNCEHFATWCKTGIAASQQIEGLKKIALMVALPMLVGSILEMNRKGRRAIA